MVLPEAGILSLGILSCSNSGLDSTAQTPSEIIIDEILLNALNRVEKNFSEEVSQNLYFVVRDQSLSYPLTGCGKRIIALLEKEGSEAIKEIDSKDDKKLINHFLSVFLLHSKVYQIHLLNFPQYFWTIILPFF